MSDSERVAFQHLVETTRGPQPWRRVFHALNGVVVGLGLWLVAPPRELLLGLLAGVVLLLLLVDVARLAFPWMNLLFFRFFRVLASPREAGGVASSTWYMAGILVVVTLFPLSLAVPAVLVLALADPAASYLGRRFGRVRVGTGSLEGMAVFLVVAMAVLLPFVPPGPALAAALVAAMVEVIPWRLDDNLTIPVATASTLWLLGAGI